MGERQPRCPEGGRLAMGRCRAVRARKELLRPAILASFLSRCLVAALTLTVNFADSVLLILIGFIVPYRLIRAMIKPPPDVRRPNQRGVSRPLPVLCGRTR
jgi:hypothetical protein